MNEYGDENQDYNIMLPSGGRRRSSMFDPDGEMMQKRKSRLDSMVSFSSDTDFDKMMTAMPKRRESRLAYENTYQLEPTEKPNLRQIQNAIYEVINTTCQDLEYEYISPCDVIKNVNQGEFCDANLKPSWLLRECISDSGVATTVRVKKWNSDM